MWLNTRSSIDIAALSSTFSMALLNTASTSYQPASYCCMGETHLVCMLECWEVMGERLGPATWTAIFPSRTGSPERREQ